MSKYQLINTKVVSVGAGAIVVLVGKLLGRALTVLANILLARILGPSIYGVYAIGWTILRLLSIITPLGLDNGVIKFGAPIWQKNKPSLRKLFVKIIVISLASSLFFSLALYGLAPKISVIFFDSVGLVSVLKGFAFALFFYALLKILAATTRVTGKMHYSVLTEDLFPPVIAISSIIILYFSIGKSAAIGAYAFIIAFALSAVLGAFYCYKLVLIKFTNSDVLQHQISSKEILFFSIPTALTGMIGTLSIWADRIIIGYLMSSADVGVYQAISQISTIFTVIVFAFGTVLAPQFATFIHQHEHKKLERLYQVGTKWGIIVSVPFFLTIVFSGEEILRTVFGNEYVLGLLPLLILTIGQMINLITGSVGVVLIMSGYQKLWLTINLFMLITNISLNVFLISTFGLVGASISTAFSVASTYIVGVIFAKWKLNISPFNKSSYKWLIAFASSAVLMGALQPLQASFYTDKLLILNFLVITFAFGTTLAIIGLEKEDKQFLSLLRHQLIGYLER